MINGCTELVMLRLRYFGQTITFKARSTNFCFPVLRFVILFPSCFPISTFKDINKRRIARAVKTLVWGLYCGHRWRHPSLGQHNASLQVITHYYRTNKYVHIEVFNDKKTCYQLSPSILFYDPVTRQGILITNHF